MKRFLLATLLLLFVSQLWGQKKKVACVGNSVTWGYELPNRETECYPNQLGMLLGSGYEVMNFGVSGSTLLRNGHRPYYKEKAFADAIAYKPDVVVISLGLNDTDPRDWPDFHDQFIPDYHKLIASFKEANPNAEIWVCQVTPIFPWHPRFRTGTRDWYWQIQNAIKVVAEGTNSRLIDLYSPLHNRPDLFKDALHPNAEGAKIIATTVYGYLTGSWGGLKLAAPFSDHMVLQRDKDIPVWGTANSGETVVVSFKGVDYKGLADATGKWKIVLPKQKAGGPFDLKVATSSKSISLTDVLIGEVWLCSGQSNMQFQLQSSFNASQDIQNATNSNIRLLNFQQTGPLDDKQWSDSVMDLVDKLDYHRGSWQVCTPESAKYFSAVAYYFGRKLSEELKVPVGLVLNAVGGSPMESWIARYDLEHNDSSLDLFTNWDRNDKVDAWVKQRCKENTGASTNVMQRHPFHPSYLYEASIEKIAPMALRGVIWYQGESNAQNMESFRNLFPQLIDSWRNTWGEEIPWGYVQISSLSRSSWPSVRDMQRRLMSVRPHLGMVVSSDVGDSLNVHPTQKQPVGERLYKWAMGECYGKKGVLLSPFFKDVTFSGSAAIVNFDNGNGLKSSDGKAIRDFEVAGSDKIFYSANATIQKGKVVVESDQVKEPKFVRYGWKPYFVGNLVNSENLPVSTFTSEL